MGRNTVFTKRDFRGDWDFGGDILMRQVVLRERSAQNPVPPEPVLNGLIVRTINICSNNIR